MTETRILLMTLLLLVPTAVYGQTLPPKVRDILNQNYSGWKLHAGDRICKSRSVVSGKFNADAVTDYAVMLKKGRQGYVIAFLSEGLNYPPHVLESRASKDMAGVFLSVGRKGTSYGEIIDDNFNRNTRRLQYDAPEGGNCESSSYYWIYQNGRFRQAFTSD